MKDVYCLYIPRMNGDILFLLAAGVDLIMGRATEKILPISGQGGGLGQNFLSQTHIKERAFGPGQNLNKNVIFLFPKPTFFQKNRAEK